jgi:hypothetical protein
MDMRTFNLDHLPGKSLFISMLIHGWMLSAFIFVLPVFPQPHKPHLVFLGSILQTSDISTGTLPDRAVFERSLDNLSFTQRQSRFFDSSVAKPQQRKEYLPVDKKTLKFNEPSTVKAAEEKSELLQEDIEIDYTLEPYRPLRLKPND